ncbi:MAG: aryl-sulfate sulfotransferase [Paludibacter sp.]|nr:aryl-sulfate sulfotransferase [Paludibacter sp.]
MRTQIKNISNKSNYKAPFRGLGAFLFLFFIFSSFSQTRTVGLFLNDTAKVYKGYTLFAPKQYHTTYLINNEGRVVHQWSNSIYPPGQSVYLLPNGHILRSCMTKGQLSSGGGEGGRIEEYDWDDNLVWELDFSTATYMQHHDIHILPNGNIIMLVIEKKTLAECAAAGFNTANFQLDPKTQQLPTIVLPDYVAEIKPTYPKGGTVVWEWHTWDHLIQDFDATKLNYGTPKQHPELVDCDGDGKKLPAFWNHMNSIDYNEQFDQIALSVRGNSEVWIIDHSTTTAEAKSHAGGNRGKGGDLLYRWGNPICYGAGTASDQRYFQQHDVEWVKPGYPGAGNMTCFDNGLGRGGSTIYSTVDEFTPAVDANGNYAITVGSKFLPATYSWFYQADAISPMYSENISGAERLPNGNTIICSGTIGEFREVTADGQVVWKYVCPVQLNGVITQGVAPDVDAARADETMNSVFRVYKYPLDYPAFTGKTMTPGDFIEKYPSGINDVNNTSNLLVYPNPFSTKINLQNAVGDESFELINSIGQTIWSGNKIVEQDLSNISKGMYFLKIKNKSNTQVTSLIKR